ncbi:MAG: aminoacetone oxidase family FAD-binding enzyme [Firmicutes bacterium]|nr:aminoacetone oxidase family FAD-binding enzyme [Bacillota bacterium]
MKIAIIGAGAAGLMCACMLPVEYDVTVFDGNSDAGAKLLLTGNGRCNITNLVSVDEFLKSVPRNAEFLTPSLKAFTPADTVAFFEGIGISTKIENNNRVFPAVDKAKGVRDALKKHALSRGVNFKFNTIVRNIDTSFDVVIIATGGVSFPNTGSTGDGYLFAKQFGHDIVPPRPALTGLLLEIPTGFMGTSVHVSAAIGDVSAVGDMMFTKDGVSGPVIFKLTSLINGPVHGREMLIDFVPHIDRPVFDAKDKPFYAFRKYLPDKVANWLAARGDKPADIKSIRVPIRDFMDIKTATVTRGGVDVSQIDANTMQSKLASNVYFIGEVLDVDGLSGGFNLQIAFSTAVACARAVSYPSAKG